GRQARSPVRAPAAGARQSRRTHRHPLRGGAGLRDLEAGVDPRAASEAARSGARDAAAEAPRGFDDPPGSIRVIAPLVGCSVVLSGRGRSDHAARRVPVQTVAGRCATVLAPRAVSAWDSRVKAISSLAEVGIPDRVGHAGDYASALSPSVAAP